MAEFYYKVSGEESAYCIDEVSQQILVYLFSNRESELDGLVDKVGVNSESEVHDRIKNQLGTEAAELITQSPMNQETIGDREPLTYYELTEEGDQFVRNNKATLSMPADFKELADIIGGLREDVIEIQDSMHRIDADELNEELSTLAHRLESLQTHISSYE
jgi:hypothetical protein